MRIPRTSCPSAATTRTGRYSVKPRPGHRRRALRQRFRRSEKRLPQVRRSAVDPDLREVRAEAAALAVDDVARRAAELRVDRATLVGIAARCSSSPRARANGRRRRADSARWSVSRRTRGIPRSGIPSRMTSLSASSVAARRQRGSIQAGPFVAGAVDAVTACAHAVEQLLARSQRSRQPGPPRRSAAVTRSA